MNNFEQQGVSRRSFLVGAGLTAAAGVSLVSLGCTPTTDQESHADESSAPLTAGTGSSMGKNGELSLRAIVEGTELSDIALTRSHETLCVGTDAQDILKGLILENQTLNVDSISGATLTSMGYINALKEALDSAGLDSAEWSGRAKAELVRPEPIPGEVDVVVIGSGGAGLSAAITAAKQDKTVLVLEKLGVFGGSTALSGAGFAAPGTWPQIQKGVEDTPEKMAEDMLIGGDNEGDPELVKVVCENALDCVNWLSYEIGIEWDSICVQDGGHSVARSIIPRGYGAEVAQKLVDRCRALEVQVAANMKVEKLLQDSSGAISGIEAEDLLTGELLKVNANTVIIASGGFGNNEEMRVEYAPEFDNSYKCTDSIGITGDGIIMAQEIGAGVTDMQFIQTHPTGDPQTGAMLDVGGVRADGGAIMVNLEGKRFVEELERRDVTSKATLEQTGGLGYFVTTKKNLEELGYYDFSEDEIASLTDRQLFFEGETLEEACATFGIDVSALEETWAIWNEDCAKGVDSQFNYRADLIPIEEGPYCVFACTPTVHYTMGGLTIDPQAQVLNEQGTVIPGLFAAGEVTGNIMGTNRLGTTSMSDIFAFGRTAGKGAAAQ